VYSGLVIESSLLRNGTMAEVGLAEILPALGGYQQTDVTARMVPLSAGWLVASCIHEYRPTTIYD
jgi:hypothetical protein